MAIQLNQIQSTEWSFDINGVGQVVQGLDDIKQCVRIILETVPGSDPLRPNFGCGIYTFIDRPVTSAISDMKKAVIDCLTLFEPRIEKIKVAITLNVEQLSVSTTYKIKNTVATDQIDVNYGFTNS